MRAPTPPTPTDLPASSDIGVRVWDELNSHDGEGDHGAGERQRVRALTYQSVQQQLPNVVRHRRA